MYKSGNGNLETENVHFDKTRVKQIELEILNKQAEKAKYEKEAMWQQHEEDRRIREHEVEMSARKIEQLRLEGDNERNRGMIRFSSRDLFYFIFGTAGVYGAVALALISYGCRICRK